MCCYDHSSPAAENNLTLTSGNIISLELIRDLFAFVILCRCIVIDTYCPTFVDHPHGEVGGDVYYYGGIPNSAVRSAIILFYLDRSTTADHRDGRSIIEED